MKLSAISGGSGLPNYNQAFTALALAKLTTRSPFLATLEFSQIEGNSDKLTPPVERKKAGVRRQVGDSYTARLTDYGTEKTVSLTIFGDSIRTDMAHERRFSGKTKLNSERVRQLESFADELAVGEEICAFRDKSTNAGETTGILSLLDDLPGQNLKFGGDNGKALTLGSSAADINTALAFREALDNAISLLDGTADLLCMPSAIKNRVAYILGSSIQHATYQDAFGLPVTVSTYNGIPVIGMINKNVDGVCAMDMKETCGTSTEQCGSVVAMRFGDKENLFGATNIGLVAYDLGLVGTAYETVLEMDFGIGLQNPRALARLQGIKLG